MDKLKYVYLIFNKSLNHYKIGIATNVKDRLSKLQTGNSNQLELICAIPTYEARKLEKSLHDKFSDKKVILEWFSLSNEDVEYIKSIDSLSSYFIIQNNLNAKKRKKSVPQRKKNGPKKNTNKSNRL